MGRWVRTFGLEADPFLLGRKVNLEASEETRREIDLAVKALVSAAEERASSVLRTRRPDLDRGVDLLLEKESLSPDEFPALRGRPRSAKAA